MLTPERILRAYDVQRVGTPLAESGLRELDSLTGGMVPGRVWIVVGTPGQGRTTLLTQWAAAIAGDSDHIVHMVTPREGPSEIGARLLSLLGQVPMSALAPHGSDASLSERTGTARERVAASSLCLYARGEDAYVPEIHPFRAPIAPAAILVDDAHLVSGLTPASVTRWAEAGKFVLLSLPRHLVLAGTMDEADLDPAWAGVADVVLEVRHRGLPNGVLRPGDAEVQLHYNRRGHTRTLQVVHQAHFSRFVDAQP